MNVFKKLLYKVKKGIKSGQIETSMDVDPSLLGISVGDSGRIKKKKEAIFEVKIKF